MNSSNKGFTGKTHSEETRAKISAAIRGKKHSDEARANMSAAQTGMKHTPERVEKMRAAVIVRLADPEVKAKLSTANNGKKRSEETRARMRAAHGFTQVELEALQISDPKRYERIMSNRTRRERRRAGLPSRPTGRPRQAERVVKSTKERGQAAMSPSELEALQISDPKRYKNIMQSRAYSERRAEMNGVRPGWSQGTRERFSAMMKAEIARNRAEREHQRPQSPASHQC